MLLSPVYLGWWLMLVLVALGVAVWLVVVVAPYVTYWAYHRVVAAGDERGETRTTLGDERGGEATTGREIERGERAREDA